jgi:hypothetical protein
MSNDNQITNDVEAEQSAPLRRFIKPNESRDVSTPAQLTTRLGQHWQQAAGGYENSGERRTSSTSRGGSDTERPVATKSERGSRSGKRKANHSNKARGRHRSVAITGVCRCGAETVSYDLYRCENCFAEDSDIYTGRDQSVILKF